VSLIAEESEGSISDDVLFNFEVVDDLFSVSFPVVGGDQSERGTSIEDSVDSLVRRHTAGEVSHLIGGESELRRFIFGSSDITELNTLHHSGPVEVTLEVDVSGVLHVTCHMFSNGLTEINVRRLLLLVFASTLS